MHFTMQKRKAIRSLVGKGFVSRRGAANRSGNPGTVELQSVTQVIRRWLVRHTGAMKGPEQPVARAVTGENPSGSIGPVGSRR